MAHSRLSLVIADDHTLVAQALSRVLEDEFDLLDIATDGQALVESVERLRPDLVVTDIRMPKLNGLDAIGAIRQLPDPPGIVVLSMYADTSLAQQALAAGALGYVLTQSAAQELAHALYAAHAGRRYVTPSMDMRAGPAAAPSSRLQLTRPTRRQCEVLELIARGCRMKEIASRLAISRRTVESHKYQLMANLGARSTAELVQHALRLGLIRLPAPTPPSMNRYGTWQAGEQRIIA